LVNFVVFVIFVKAVGPFSMPPAPIPRRSARADGQHKDREGHQDHEDRSTKCLVNFVVFVIFVKAVGPFSMPPAPIPRRSARADGQRKDREGHKDHEDR
jgi:hypothetical protein